MSHLQRTLATQVGRKLLMGMSGLLLSGWLLLHMLGNLLVFADPQVINRYGGALQGSPLVWVMRAGLLLLVGVHAACAVSLSRARRAARPQAYLRGRAGQASAVTGRGLFLGGALVLAFLAYHLLHIFGPLHPDYISGDVHHNLAAGLSTLGPGLAYLLAALLFAPHLWHGLASSLRTLGLAVGRRGDRLQRLSRLLMGAVTVGFSLPPLAALLGLLR